MSRSCWALAEIRRRGVLDHGAGQRRRFNGRLCLVPRRLPLSATKYAVLVAASMLLMAAEPAQALASPGRNAQTVPPANQGDLVLAPGSGYLGGKDAVLVRALQRRLAGEGYSPGPVDGRYGPRTEHAVEMFQSARGLRADGIAGPLTLAALRSTVLYPGAGYPGSGSGAVRRLQRRLRSEGYTPGPVDGRYGPRTESAVRRFQAAHGLTVDGVVGPRTAGELEHVHGGRQPSRPRPSARRTGPVHPRPRQPHISTPAHPRAPHTATPAHPRAPLATTPRSTGRHRRPTSRPGGASAPVAPVLVGVLALAALAGGVWLIDRRRRRTTIDAVPLDAATAPADGARRTEAPPQSPANSRATQRELYEPERVPEEVHSLEQYEDLAVAEMAFRQADEHGDPAAASNLGVLLEHQGDLVGAELAYRRADARGSAEGAFNLAGLLIERGDMEGAMAAYHRADTRGDPAAASTVAEVLLRTGDTAGAEAAYRRADSRGDSTGAFKLGAMLEKRGELADAAAAYDRADQRGDQEAAAKLGMLLERRHEYRAALQAYERARSSTRPEIAELARSRRDALQLGLTLAGKRGEP